MTYFPTNQWSSGKQELTRDHFYIFQPITWSFIDFFAIILVPGNLISTAILYIYIVPVLHSTLFWFSIYTANKQNEPTRQSFSQIPHDPWLSPHFAFLHRPEFLYPIPSSLFHDQNSQTSSFFLVGSQLLCYFQLDTQFLHVLTSFCLVVWGDICWYIIYIYIGKCLGSARTRNDDGRRIIIIINQTLIGDLQCM